MNENELDRDCYREGREARKHECDIDTCPYESESGASDERWSWLRGYYEYHYEMFWNHWMNKQTLGDQSKIKGILMDDDL